MLFPPLFALLVTWATPLWLLSLGAALGLAILAVAYAIVWMVSRRAAAAAVDSVREGILLPILSLALFLAAFAVLGPILVPTMPVRKLGSAVARLPSVGTREFKLEVPPSTIQHPLDLPLRLPELEQFDVESTQPLSIHTNIASSLGQTLTMSIPANKLTQWEKPQLSEKDRSRMAPPDEMIDWKATNVGAEPAKVTIRTFSRLEFPEVSVVPGTALALVGLVAAYLLLQVAFPKIAAIALTTSKEAMSQPLFYVVLGLGSFALLAFIFVPYNTLGEDVKMLKDSGLTLIMVLSIIVAVWSASVSVSEEVEGRTALTVLSKPVLRRQFVIGKFLGVLGPVIVLFVVLGILFLITVSYKVVYDSRETSQTEPFWQTCYSEMIGVVPGLVLAFFEAVVLSAISVAMSTRLPTLANLIVCASIYVLGHLVPMLVNSAVGKFEIVRFIGQFIATILPVLDHFNIQAAVAAGAHVPLQYLGLAFLYCVLYSTIAMLLGLAMFEDRDLA